MSLEFRGLHAKINRFQKLAPLIAVNMTEEWYKNNIRLGGEQKAGGLVKPFFPRTRNYAHPILNETGQLLNSIKATYQRTKLKVTYKVDNYRGKRDYGKIHNRYGTPTKLKGDNFITKIVRPFMTDSKALTDKMQHKLVGMLKKIFI